VANDPKADASRVIQGVIISYPCTPVRYLTNVIPVPGFPNGTGWEADDRQGDGAGVSADVLDLPLGQDDAAVERQGVELDAQAVAAYRAARRHRGKQIERSDTSLASGAADATGRGSWNMSRSAMAAATGLSTPVFYSWLQRAYLESVNAIRETGK
jgi:hypothetical protein